jgi:hypothetical protein
MQESKLVPSRIGLKYRGIELVVGESGHSGFFQFSFTIGDELVRGQTRTRLAGMAVRRGQRAIDRKLRERRARAE